MHTALCWAARASGRPLHGASRVNFLCWEPLTRRLLLAAVTFEDLNSDDPRIRTFLEALSNFTSGERPRASPPGRDVPSPRSIPPGGDPKPVPCPSPEDLSRFLKFVTGRSRLPVQILVYPDRSG